VKFCPNRILYIVEGGRVMPAKKDKSVKTSLTQEDYDSLVKFCEDRDESMSQVIRKAIKEYLENHN
jgi:hypothetical protein